MARRPSIATATPTRRTRIKSIPAEEPVTAPPEKAPSPSFPGEPGDNITAAILQMDQSVKVIAATSQAIANLLTRFLATSTPAPQPAPSKGPAPLPVEPSRPEPVPPPAVPAPLAQAPKAAAPVPATSPAPSGAPSRDEVKEVLLRVAKAHGRDKLIALFQAHGGTKLSDVPEGHLKSLKAAAEAEV